MMPTESTEKWSAYLNRARHSVAYDSTLEVRGTLTRLTGLVLEARGIQVPVGSQCVVSMKTRPSVLAEVVGFAGDRAFLMPAGDVHGLSSGAGVAPAAAYVPVPRLGEPERTGAVADAGMLRLPLGDGLLGRVVDAQGFPMDRLGPITEVVSRPLDRKPINAMDEPLSPAEEAAFQSLSLALAQIVDSNVPCTGDGNLDGVIDALDIEQLEYWQELTGYSSWYDFDLNGLTNAADLAFITTGSLPRDCP